MPIETVLAVDSRDVQKTLLFGRKQKSKPQCNAVFPTTCSLL